jgi:hypothetical protein
MLKNYWKKVIKKDLKNSILIRTKDKWCKIVKKFEKKSSEWIEWKINKLFIFLY